MVNEIDNVIALAIFVVLTMPTGLFRAISTKSSASEAQSTDRLLSQRRRISPDRHGGSLAIKEHIALLDIAIRFRREQIPLSLMYLFKRTDESGA